MATQNGIVKKTPLSEFKKPRKNGKRAIKLDDNDELVGTLLTDGNADLMVVSNAGKAVFFNDSATQKKYHVAYGASKVAQLFLVKSWKVENQKKSLQIIIEEPAPMATKTREKFYPGEDKSKLSDPETEAKLILNRILK